MEKAFSERISPSQQCIVHNSVLFTIAYCSLRLVTMELIPAEIIIKQVISASLVPSDRHFLIVVLPSTTATVWMSSAHVKCSCLVCIYVKCAYPVCMYNVRIKCVCQVRITSVYA